MIDSFDDKTSLNKLHDNDNDDSDDNESDLKTNDAIKWIQFLTNEEYNQFNQSIDQYKPTKQEIKILQKQLSLNCSVLLLFLFLDHLVYLKKNF